MATERKGKDTQKITLEDGTTFVFVAPAQLGPPAVRARVVAVAARLWYSARQCAARHFGIAEQDVITAVDRP